MNDRDFRLKLRDFRVTHGRLETYALSEAMSHQ